MEEKIQISEKRLGRRGNSWEVAVSFSYDVTNKDE